MMVILANETRVTLGDVFNYEDWNVLSGDRRMSVGLAYSTIAEDKITTYLGSDDE